MRLKMMTRTLLLLLTSVLLFTGCNGAADGTDTDTSHSLLLVPPMQQ